MAFAVRNDNRGWRAVNGPEDCTADEYFSAVQPELAPPPITPDDVAAERIRRLALGFNYDFGGSRGVHHIGTTDQDLKNWDEVTKLAQAAINLGQSDLLISIITNTGPTTVTAGEWQRVLLAAAMARQPLFQASFALEAMDPIPTDFKDDKWWSA